MSEFPKFTAEARESLEHLLEQPQLKAMAQLKSVLILSSGVPVASALLLTETLIDTLVNANREEDPEFCEYVRTRFLSALTPK